MEGFEYVVNPTVIPKVAFGTTIHREVLPTSGPSMDSFMRRLLPEERSLPGPFDYDVEKPLGYQYPSVMGFSAMANKKARLPATPEQNVPPLGTYAPERWRPTDRDGFTFNKEALSRNPKWMTPGPSTYSYHIDYPGWNIEKAFGKHRLIWPAVAVFCSPNNTAQCMTCQTSPIGDYFHNFDTNQDLCRVCMRAQMDVIQHCELQVVERFRLRRDIKRFVPARYCGFFHDHGGTTAAREITSRKELRDKIRVENYLYRFVSRQN
ncbi:uncharacterized protein LOC115634112 [Scaptodrosophila lebanonensis]|uniref:Uncharacterized protein LOC115634112 n=1 Tax=Drosophila lebanonensis TaxID=7225 RepID=A0A6J2UHC4_DROLE|nr:uncharacterized protein LOC115634112 [Scaptodrosophila lebanonensis]